MLTILIKWNNAKIAALPKIRLMEETLFKELWMNSLKRNSSSMTPSRQQIMVKLSIVRLTLGTKFKPAKAAAMMFEKQINKNGANKPTFRQFANLNMLILFLQMT